MIVRRPDARPGLALAMVEKSIGCIWIADLMLGQYGVEGFSEYMETDVNNAAGLAHFVQKKRPRRHFAARGVEFEYALIGSATVGRSEAALQGVKSGGGQGEGKVIAVFSFAGRPDGGTEHSVDFIWSKLAHFAATQRQ